MTDHAVRRLHTADLRSAHTLFRAALHHPPANDEEWEWAARSFEPDRTLGAFDDGTMIGTALSWGASMAVPGGAELALGAVTRVGVRADHTRRGVLTALMRAQLEDLAERGDVLAALHASEPAIYGRFGYGAATRGRSLRVDVRRASVRQDVPVVGEVRLIGLEEATKVVPVLYERIGRHRAGMMSRPDAQELLTSSRQFKAGENTAVAVHSGPDGDDGYVVYKPQNRWTVDTPDLTAVVDVQDLHAANPAATHALWRFLIGLDLVDEVRAWSRPLDEPVELLLTDHRACGTRSIEDEMWVRLVDVPAALAGRAYGHADGVVIEVRDRFLPVNAGRYEIHANGVRRTRAAAQLTMDVDVLAMVFLGDVRPSVLAGLGRLEVADRAALARADRLFATDQPPWCGTFF